MPLEYAHELNVLEVGKYYLVAHVKVIRNYIDASGCAEEESDEYAVIPILHKDTQFGTVRIEHYHIDGRFGQGANFSNYIAAAFSRGEDSVVMTDVYYRRRKCLYKTSGLNYPQQDKRWKEWQQSMVGKSCKGKKCPHFGANMIDVGNGTLLCPMHNLVGCAKEEKIIDLYHIEDDGIHL